MAAGGLVTLSNRFQSNSEELNIDVIGRNFDSPTQFNQVHKYRTIKDYVLAHLIKELPPVATIVAAFRLNGSASFVNFTTIERGTIVNEVRITGRGTAQVNSPLLKELLFSGGSAPALVAITPDATDTGNVFSYDSAITLNTPKTYGVRAKDIKDVLSNNATATWAVGVRAYYGKGTATGTAITEGWVRANLLKHTAFNAHMGSVTVTPGADDYIYYLAPVSWGLRVFEFLGSDQTNPEAALRIRVRTDAEMANGITQANATEYFVIRSLGKGLGSGSPYTFQIGTIG